MAEHEQEHWLRRLFLAPDIWVFGSVREPLFVASDVAKKFGDTEVIKEVPNWDPEFIVKDIVEPLSGIRIPLAFTEDGLYEYMFTIKTPDKYSFTRFAARAIADHLNEQLNEINDKLNNPNHKSKQHKKSNKK